MRIGLDFRFLNLSRTLLNRGIPRFAQEQLQAVVGLDHESTFLLICDTESDLMAIRPEIRSAPNVVIALAPVGAVEADDERSQLAAFSRYLRWLEGLHLDLYHAVCTTHTGGVLLPGFDICPYVVTAYDLIPLIYPAQYLRSDEDATVYERQLLIVEQATRVAAISHATAADLVQHLSIPPDRIDITRAAPSACFRPLSKAVVRSLLETLEHRSRRSARHQVRIPSRYVLCIAGMHYTKNTQTLLTAYAKLPGALRRRVPLVMAGDLSDHDAAHLRQRAEQQQLEQDVIVTGRVSDTELAALYNGATVMVHPSHYEGFGLPVVEAMACGAPVITTTRSALPEVAGDAAVLVDSEDPDAFAEAIQRLVDDDELRQAMGRRSRAQAAGFTPAQLGRSTLEGYAKTVGQSDHVDRLRVALWSPVPPQFSGISDYTDDLVAALSCDHGLDLHIFVDDDVMPETPLIRRARVHHSSDFERAARRAAFDVSIYQLGASTFHLYMEHAMLAHPGIVAVHDLQWSGALLSERLSRSDGNRRFRRDVEALEGDDAARRWDRVARLPSTSRHEAAVAFLDDYPMLGRVIDAAVCYVPLTEELGRELHHRYPRAEAARTIPMGVRDPLAANSGLDRAVARGFLSIDPNTFLVLVPGIADQAKHVATAIEAFARLKQPGVDACLAIVGWIPDKDYESGLRRQALRLGVSDSLILTGRVPRIVFDAYLAAADTAIVLREPWLRQMSAVLMRALAARRCVIASDIPALASIPDSACVRVGAPPRELADVTAALGRLYAAPQHREQLEGGAREYYERAGRSESMAESYSDLIRQRAPRRLPVEAPAQQRTGQTPRWGRPEPRPGRLRYNKACELEDFGHAQVRDVIRDVCSHKPALLGADFPLRREYRKDWEVAMAVRTLTDHGAVRPEARVLGVAAGTEDTIFYLTRHVGEVVAIDRYRDPGDWEETAPSLMLQDPARLAPFEFTRERLTVQHMDARVLGFADESFDGIFSSGSIEHFGDLHTIAAAAYEMGRVLKPGGILSLSTELLITPRPDGAGAAYPGMHLLSPAELQRYIVEASGLELIDGLDTSVSHWTRGTSRDIIAAITARQGRMAAAARGSRPPGWACWDTPHIVLDLLGMQFTSVHLALRRSSGHPVVDNAWARPSAALRTAVGRSEATNRAPTISSAYRDTAGNGPRAAVAAELEVLGSASHAAEERLAALRRDVDYENARLAEALQTASLPEVRGFGTRSVALRHEGDSVLPAGTVRGAPPILPAPPDDPVACAVASPLTPPYIVVVDRASDDIISAAYLAGNGAGVNAHLVALVLGLVPAGGTLVDLGANIGSISLPVAAAGRRVVSVEAAPVNIALLEAGARLSSVTNRLTVIGTAVGDHVGVARFVPMGPWGQLTGLSVTDAQRVPITTVDALIDSAHIGAIDLVKIDVEGADVDVLRGMDRLARSAEAPYLLVECCPHTLASFGRTTFELVSLLEDYGYVVYNIGDHRLIRRRPDEVQITTVMDVLAAKHGVVRLPGWRVEPPMTVGELAERLVDESQLDNPHCRAAGARAARRLAPEILALPSVTAALSRLRNDTDPVVRAAAAWWRDTRAE